MPAQVSSTVSIGTAQESSRTVTIPATTAGNLLILTVGIGNALVDPVAPTISDSAAQTWSSATSVIFTGIHSFAGIWYVGPTADGVTSVTVNFGTNPSADTDVCRVQEVSGCLTPHDAATGVTSGTAGTTATTGTIWTTGGDWVVGHLQTNGAVGFSGEPAGWTNDTTDTAAGASKTTAVQHGYMTAATTGNQSYSATLSTATYSLGVIASFYAASSPHPQTAVLQAVQRATVR